MRPLTFKLFGGPGQSDDFFQWTGGTRFVVTTQKGNDTVIDGGGWRDFVNLGQGDDHLIRDGLSAQNGGLDRYIGGGGTDTFTLNLSRAEWRLVARDLRADLLSLQTLIENGQANQWFEFEAIDVELKSFEDIRLVVNGRELSISDSPVVARDDFFTIGESDVVRASLIANDDIPDLLRVIRFLEPAPDAGELTKFRKGQFQFDTAGEYEALAKGEIQEISFRYRVVDMDRDRDEATVFIRIVGENDAPVLASGVLQATEDGGAVAINLAELGSDTDADDDGTSLTYSITGSPAEGRAWIDGTSLRFDTDGGFQDLNDGQSRDVFVEVTATDRHGAQTSAMVRVTVNGADEPLITSDDSFTISEDGILDASVVANDQIDNGVDKVELVGDAPADGTLTLRNDGTFTFTPGADFDRLPVGTSEDVTFRYRVTDNAGAVAEADATITVEGANDAPVLPDDAGVLRVAPGRNLDATDGLYRFDFSTLGFDLDPDDDDNGFSLTYEITGGLPEGFAGTAGIDGHFLTFTSPILPYWALDGGEIVDAQIEVTATDRHGASDTTILTIEVEGQHDRPSIDVGGLTLNEDDTALFDIVSFFRPVDNGDTIELLEVYSTDPNPDPDIPFDDPDRDLNNAAVSIEDGKIRYTPNEDYFGLDQIFYKVRDDDGLEWFGRAEVTVLPQVQAPEISYSFRQTPFRPLNEFTLRVQGDALEKNENRFQLNNTLDRIELRGFDASGLEVDLTNYLAETSYEFPDNVGKSSFDFRFVLPEGEEIDLDIEIKAVSEDLLTGDTAETIEMFDINLETALTRSTQTFDIATQDIWNGGGQFNASETFSGTFDEGGTILKNLVQFDARLGGVGVTTDFSVRADGSASGEVGVTATASGQGGQVSGSLAYDTSVQTLIDRGSDVLIFDTSSAANAAVANFVATTPDLNFDLSLTDLNLQASFAAVLWGYLHFHTGFNTIKPVDRGNFFDGWRAALDVDADVSGLLGPGGLSLLNFDGTEVSLLEGAKRTTDLKGIFEDFLKNDLFEYDLQQIRGVTNDVDTRNGGTISGEVTRKVAQVDLDLDSIASSLLGKFNVLGQTEDQSQGPFAFRAGWDLLDLDLVLPVSYRQTNSLDTKTLTGVVRFEDGSERAFVFGDRFSVDNASSLDANGDGQIGYDILMTPAASFTSNAFLELSAFDRLRVIAAELTAGVSGGSYFGVSTPGFGIDLSLGPVFGASGTVINENTSINLAQSAFNLEVGQSVSETFLI